MKTKICYLLITFSIVLAMVLSACGGGATPTPEPTAVPPTEIPTTPPQQPTSEPTKEPIKTPEVEEIIGSETMFNAPSDLDPSQVFDYSFHFLLNVYETLTWYNLPGSSEMLSPKLATSWESNKDATEWTFNLRKGVKFHDGTDFNAQAVKFSFERSSKPGMNNAFIFDAIQEMEIVDDYTIKFHCKYSAPLALIFSAGFGAWIMSPTAVGDKDSAWFNQGNDAGTGPYTFESYEPGQRLLLKRFEDYWGGWENGQFTKVIYETVPDAATREQMLRNGDVDIAEDIDEESYAALAKESGIAVNITPSFAMLFGFFNETKPPLDNMKVRQALAYSFPYDDALKIVQGGHGKPGRGTVPELIWGHDPNLVVPFDQEKAAQLLEEAGYPKGAGLRELVIWTYAGGAPVFQKLAELWQAKLAEIGVTLKIVPMEMGSIWDAAFHNPKNAYDMLLRYWTPTFPTPYDLMFMNFDTAMKGTCCNLGYYSNPKFDELIKEANIVSGYDLEKASQMFQEAQRMLVDDAAGIFIANPDLVFFYRANITGLVNNPSYGGHPLWYGIRRSE
jgi:peptide/nickel transport system substrate-binding protein